MRTSGSKLRIANELSSYSQDWSSMMVKIWRDRIGMLQAIDSRRLFDSVSAVSPTIQGLSATFHFRFLQYGIYVDLGTGKGYKRGNGGDLVFLGKGYRSLHKLGRMRKKKPWYSTSFAISQRVLAKKYIESVGDTFTGIFDELK